MKGTFFDRLRNLQCRVANFLRLDLCICCGHWHRKSQIDAESLCKHCSAFVWMDRNFSRTTFTVTSAWESGTGRATQPDSGTWNEGG